MMLDGDGSQHIVTERSFIECVGRSGNVEQQAASLPYQFGYGIALVEALGPEIFVVPAIFANGDAQYFGIQPEDVLRVSGLEIARFIEHVVRGQQHLALLENNFSVGDESRGIRHWLPGVVLCLTDVPDK